MFRRCDILWGFMGFRSPSELLQAQPHRPPDPENRKHTIKPETSVPPNFETHAILVLRFRRLCKLGFKCRETLA